MTPSFLKPLRRDVRKRETPRVCHPQPELHTPSWGCSPLCPPTSGPTRTDSCRRVPRSKGGPQGYGRDTTLQSWPFAQKTQSALPSEPSCSLSTAPPKPSSCRLSDHVPALPHPPDRLSHRCRAARVAAHWGCRPGHPNAPRTVPPATRGLPHGPPLTSTLSRVLKFLPLLPPAHPSWAISLRHASGCPATREGGRVTMLEAPPAADCERRRARP